MLHAPVSIQPEIVADRFVLRPLRRSDAGLIGIHAGDLRVAQMTQDIPHPFPPGAAEVMIERANADARTTDVWAIDGSSQGHAEVMGLVSLERMDRDQSEIRFGVAPAFWNTGIATEAIGALMEANPQASHEIFACVFQDNPGTARVLVNCGFEYLGDAEAHSVARGANIPTWTYMLKL
jgi:RimJ/RimL family protein N-acetyltransferase